MPHPNYSYSPLDWDKIPDMDTIMFGDDPRFWMELFVNVPSQSGSLPFVLYPWMHEVAEGGVTHREFMLKAREIGSSTFWLVEKLRKVLTHPGANLLIAAHKEDAARTLISIARHVVYNLPEKYRPIVTKDNENLLEFGKLGNHIKALPGTTTASRSERCLYLICTEMGMWGAEGKVDPMEYWQSVTGALVKGGEISIESTANGQGNLFHQMYYDVNNGYRKHFYPWQANPEHDPAWYAQRRLDSSAQGDANFIFLRDYPDSDVQAFATSTDSYFDMDAIQQGQYFSTKALLTHPMGKGLRAEGYKSTWKGPILNHHYVIGSDVAEGKPSGRYTPDWSTAAVMDWNTREIVCTIHCRLTTDDFAVELVTLGREYNNAHIAVERNNAGLAVITMMRAIGYDNLYKMQVQDPLINGLYEVKEDYGWLTTSKSKSVGLTNLHAAMKKNAFTCYDGAVWDECKSLGRDMRALGQAHDDRVMALMIAWNVCEGHDPIRSQLSTINPREPLSQGSWIGLW